MSHHSHTAISQRAIALAALTQAVYLVDSIARKGMADSDDCRTMLESIFREPVAADQQISLYYNGTPALQTGLRICSRMLKGDNLPQHKALMTYSAGLLTLEGKLTQNRAIQQQLAAGMQRINNQRHYFGDTMHPNIIAAIADLYGETISQMKPRIMVRGKSEYLSQQGNTRRVRALLMAGLRAAHLWHSQGGGHLTLLFRRKALLREMEQLLQE